MPAGKPEPMIKITVTFFIKLSVIIICTELSPKQSNWTRSSNHVHTSSHYKRAVDHTCSKQHCTLRGSEQTTRKQKRLFSVKENQFILLKMAEAASAQPDDDIVEIAKELFSSSIEYPAPVEATVIGKIPGWFEGSLIRVGPGDDKYNCPYIVIYGVFHGISSLYSFLAWFG